MCYEEIITLLNKENWSLAGSIATLTVAISAILVAIWQLHVGRTETRSAQAHEVYQQYLGRCIEYPELAEGYVALENPDPKYNRYKWFVSSMLFSFEQILEAKPKDDHWIAAIESQLSIHKAHLSKSKSLKTGEWDDALQKLLNKAVAK